MAKEDRLLSQLNTSKTAASDQALWQVIKQLIKRIRDLEALLEVNGITSGSGGTANTTNITQIIQQFDIGGNSGSDGGEFGPPGMRGIDGSIGPAGAIGLIGPIGMDGIDGQDGISIQGPIGLTGVAGPMGIPGIDGIDGDSIIMGGFQPWSAKLDAYSTLATGTGVLTNNGTGGLSWSAAGSGTITGSGTIGKIAKFTSASAVGDSIITELTGNIGISVASPNGLLSLSKFMPAAISSGAARTDATILLYDLGASNWAGMGVDANGNFWFRNGLATSNYLVMLAGGSVGVGTTNPLTKFHVDPGINTAGRIRLGGDGAATKLAYNLALDTATGTLNFEEGTGGVIRLSLTQGGVALFGTTAMKIHGPTGGVSIGDTTDPGATNFRVAGTSTLVGNVTASGTLTVNTAGGNVSWGTYTPTISGATNLDTTPAGNVTSYLRIGNTVSVAGQLTVDPTIAGVCTFRMSLPIASNFGGTTQAGGTANLFTKEAGIIISNAINDEVEFQWTALGITSSIMAFSFQYQII